MVVHAEPGFWGAVKAFLNPQRGVRIEVYQPVVGIDAVGAAGIASGVIPHHERRGYGWNGVLAVGGRDQTGLIRAGRFETKPDGTHPVNTTRERAAGQLAVTRRSLIPRVTRMDGHTVFTFNSASVRLAPRMRPF